MSLNTDGLKNIETGGSFQKTTLTSISNLDNNKLLYTYANLNDTTRPYGNLFKSFNFPITQNEIGNFNSFYDNQTQPTALGNLNVNEIIVVEIPKGEYGELIDQ